MKQLKMYINQRIFEAGLYLSCLKRGDFPAMGWTSFAIRVSVVTVVFMIIIPYGA